MKDEQIRDLIKQPMSGVLGFPLGSANAAYIAAILEGGTNHSYYKVPHRYINLGADNYNLAFGVPLSPLIGSKKLYISSIRLGINDADAGDFVDAIYLKLHTDYDTVSDAVSDGTNRTAPEEYDYDQDPAIDCSAARRIQISITCSVTNADDLDISYVAVKYYYDD